MGKWSNLTAQQKAAVIKFAIGNGVSDINTIRDTYNIYAEGGSIHIDPSKKGTFTAAAKKHGKSVQAFASQVLAHKENYSPAMVKKAVFAHNSKSWKHSTGGPLYPFSFEKNPYLKTPVVRYDEGGPMNLEFLPSDSVQNKQVWLNKGTKFQKQLPGTVNIQNIQDALNPSGSDIQYIWDSPEKESYSAFRRNPDYRAPLLPNIKVEPQALSVAPVSIPKINVSTPKPSIQYGFTKELIKRPENWVPMETAWNPGYGYETFHLDNSPYYGIKYYSVPGSINAGEGNRAVLDSVAMGLPIQTLNSRIFDYKLKHKDWGEFNKVE